MERIDSSGEKRAFSALPFAVALYVLYLILPAVALADELTVYSVFLLNYTLWAEILMLASAGCAVLVSLRGCAWSKPSSVLLGLSPLLAVLNAFCFLDPMSEMTDARKLLVVACLIVSGAACCYMCVRFSRSRPLMITVLSINGVILIPLAFFVFIACTFGSIGADTVVRSLPSPDGRLIAEVIDDDQGALGGSTQVWIRGSREGSFLLIGWKETGKRLYYGKWGEFNRMTLEWKDGETLLIDGKSYRAEYP